MSIQQCETCDFHQVDQQEAYCVRCRLRTVVAAAERVLSGARTGLDNLAVIALYEAVKPMRATGES